MDRHCADALMTLPSVPNRQAGFYHDFFCPEHAVELVDGLADAAGFRCPIDGGLFRGEPFEGAALWRVNDRLSDAAFCLSYSAAMQPDAPTSAPFRAAATQILTSYAGRYLSYQRLSNHPDGYDGIATFTVLDESVWIIRLAWAYALLGGHLARGNAKQVRDGLLRPAGELIHRTRWPDVHNMTVWNDSALITIGLTLGDAELVRGATFDHLGLRDQLVRGVGADGLWWEGSLSYHYYALAGAIWGVRALRAADLPFDDGAVLRRMFVGPLALALPDLSLPAMNDCWYGIGLLGRVGHGIPSASGIYEVGFAWTGDPVTSWVLRANEAAGADPTIESLMDGSRPLLMRHGHEAPTPDNVASPSGLAVLRCGPISSASGPMIVVKAGPGRGMHGHPDQLGLLMSDEEGRILDDFGTPGYGVPLSETWYNQTAAHNTILIDGLSQPLTDGSFHTGFDADGHGTIDASVEWAATDANAYAGVRARRRVVLGAGFLVEVVDVVSPREHVIDLAMLPTGRLMDPGSKPEPAQENALGAEGGFESWVGLVEITGAERLSWQRPSGGVLHAFFGPTPLSRVERLIAGRAPANPASVSVATLLRRRRARSHRFATVLIPLVAASSKAAVEVAWVVSKSRTTVRVKIGSSTEKVVIDDDETGSALAP